MTIYIVEHWYHGRWVPYAVQRESTTSRTMLPWSTAQKAQDHLNELQALNPTLRFRVAEYERVTSA